MPTQISSKMPSEILIEFAAAPDVPLRLAEIAERIGVQIQRSKERLGSKGLFESTQKKADGSPVSSVDLAAHASLVEELQKLSEPFSGFPIVSEEDSLRLEPEEIREKRCRFFWLVDPLDGTRDFLGGEETYAVVIALMSLSESGIMRPEFGVISTPEFEGGSTWFGGSGTGLSKKPYGSSLVSQVLTREPVEKPPRVLGSRSIPSSRIQKLYELFQVTSVTRLGSAIKFALIAEGRFDLYPRLGPTSEWDTAAGHALLNSVGGELFDLTTKRVVAYGKNRWENNAFLAAGCNGQYEKEIERLHSLLFTTSKS